MLQYILPMDIQIPPPMKDHYGCYLTTLYDPKGSLWKNMPLQPITACNPTENPCSKHFSCPFSCRTSWWVRLPISQWHHPLAFCSSQPWTRAIKTYVSTSWCWTRGSIRNLSEELRRGRRWQELWEEFWVQKVLWKAPAIYTTWWLSHPFEKKKTCLEKIIPNRWGKKMCDWNHRGLLDLPLSGWFPVLNSCHRMTLRQRRSSPGGKPSAALATRLVPCNPSWSAVAQQSKNDFKLEMEDMA